MQVELTSLSQKNLYDSFYEGNEAGLDPPGLFDYSKGKWTAVTAATTVQVWSGSSLVPAALTAYSGNTRKVIMSLCGFASAGTGKLIGPDGSEVDTESFLSDLRIYGTSGISHLQHHVTYYKMLLVSMFLYYLE
jgi:hypothetical protein